MYPFETGIAPVTIDWCVLSILLLTLVASAISDLKSRKIYNRYTYSAFLLICGLGMFNWISGLISAGFHSEALSISTILLGGFGCFGAMIVIHVLGGGGAGDVKLAAVVGAGLGFRGGIQAIGYTYLLTAIAMIVLCIFQKGVRNFLVAIFRSLFSRFLPLMIQEPTDEDQELLKQSVPLGPGFLAGTLIVLWDQGWWHYVQKGLSS